MQMICLSLIHGSPLPAPLGVLSPWIDWDVEPQSFVYERLAAQTHRRVIKTHTPLDGIPLRDDVAYIVVGRHPLDVAVSLYHHIGNIDQVRSADLRGEQVADNDRGTLKEWLDRWIDDPRPPEEALDTLAGNVHHVSDAWGRRVDGNVVLVHFAELRSAHEAVIRSLAAWLGIDVADGDWTTLVNATSFEAMRAQPETTVPDRVGVLKDAGAFFRSGSIGEGARLCSAGTLRRYHERLVTTASPEVVAWLHQ